jgi:hypothetical protein
MEVVVGVAGVLAIAGCVLVWRLAQGPIDITTLVQREQHRFPNGGAEWSVGHAALAWEGFHDPDSPLDIRFSNLRLADTNGAVLATFPSGRVTLAVAPLWHGAILPRTVVLDGASVTLQRGADGAVQMNFGADKPGTSAPSTPAPPNNGASWLARLTRPGAIPVLNQLRTVRLEHAALTLHDAALGVQWHADAAEVVAIRNTDGSLTGRGVLQLAVGEARASVATQVALDSSFVQITARVPTPVWPTAVAAAVPALASLAALDAPLTAQFSARLDAGFAVRKAALSIQAGAGIVHLGLGEVALAQAAATLRTDGKTTRLDGMRIALAPPPGARLSAPVLSGSATLARNQAGWHADFGLAVDHAALADLADYWPRGTGGGSRGWLIENINTGVAENAKVTGGLDAAPDGTAIRLTDLSGGMDGHDVSVNWLRPVPPVEHAEAHLVIDGPDSMHIDIPHAVQGPIALSGGLVRITGLSARDQFGSIVLHGDGALADALALLNHPRLKLLSRQPFALDKPSGQASIVLNVHLPLDDRITFDDIGINATARLSDVHLSGIAVGRDLDGADLNLAVDTNQLTIGGDGRLGGVPATLGLTMDFRNGPPTQVTSRVTATGQASAAQLAAAWLPGGIVTGGDAGFDMTYALRRDATATVVMRLDARAAAIATPFGWSKPVGPPAQASAQLRLAHDRLVGIDAISASGPDLKLASHGETQAGLVSTLVLDQLRLGRTSVHGTVGFPGPSDAPWRVMLRGTALDVSSYLKRRDDGDTSDDENRSHPWQADLAFDHVVLARDETLAPVTLKADDDGLHFTRLDLSAGGGPRPAQVRASIEPASGGRALHVNATDAGAVLLATGVADNIRGGQLKLDGTFDDAAPHAPLTGTAQLDNFRITDAPAIGRLLKAMTLYGAGDLLRGPGLGFGTAVVPFHWQQRVLSLNNARAFSASLGLTAQGDLDLRHHTADITGTIVPAYFFNQLLGKLPVLGKLFSPETGGGVFAARYSVRGSLKDPKVAVNPLSALTPGFLRGVFGILK